MPNHTRGSPVSPQTNGISESANDNNACIHLRTTMKIASAGRRPPSLPHESGTLRYDNSIGPADEYRPWGRGQRNCHTLGGRTPPAAHRRRRRGRFDRPTAPRRPTPPPKKPSGQRTGPYCRSTSAAGRRVVHRAAYAGRFVLIGGPISWWKRTVDAVR